MYQTPILFIVFNRPDTTKRVFESIRKARPAKLYVAADGPRENKQEIERCDETRKIIGLIDWPCEVRTLFQDKNLGCKWGPITAIDWFFKNEEMGIILEDDCLPDPSFFSFCSELLDYYKDNEQVMHISGNNFQGGIKRGEASYYFSKYSHSWGWATRRRAWDKFHPALDNFFNFDKEKLIEKVPISKNAQKFWIKNLRQTIKGNDSWDSLWMYTIWANDGLCVIPNKNLVSNIGFGENATHTKKSSDVLNSLHVETLGDIIHPMTIIQNEVADNFIFQTLFYRPVIKRITNKIKLILKKD